MKPPASFGVGMVFVLAAWKNIIPGIVSGDRITPYL